MTFVRNQTVCKSVKFSVNSVCILHQEHRAARTLDCDKMAAGDDDRRP